MVSPRTVGVRVAATGRVDGVARWVDAGGRVELEVADEVRGIVVGAVPAECGRLVERTVLGLVLGWVGRELGV